MPGQATLGDAICTTATVCRLHHFELTTALVREGKIRSLCCRNLLRAAPRGRLRRDSNAIEDQSDMVLNRRSRKGDRRRDSLGAFAHQ